MIEFLLSLDFKFPKYQLSFYYLHPCTIYIKNLGESVFGKMIGADLRLWKKINQFNYKTLKKRSPKENIRIKSFHTKRS